MNKRSRLLIPPSVWCCVVQEDIVSSLPSTGSTKENVTAEQVLTVALCINSTVRCITSKN